MSNLNEKHGSPYGRCRGQLADDGSPKMPPFASMDADHAIVWYENGAYVKDKSLPEVSGGVEGVLGFSSDLPNATGVLATQGSYTLEGADIYLTGCGKSDFSGVGSGILAYKDANLTLKNVKVETAGAVRTAVTAMGNSTLTACDCTFITHGGPLPEDYVPVVGPGMMTPPAPLGLEGDCRTHLTMDNSESFFYNCDIVADGWGALSTDSSGGYVYLEANGCRVAVTGNGYGTYSDNYCHNVFNGCTFQVSNMAAIQDGNSDVTFNNCQVECGKVGFMLHGAMAGKDQVGMVRLNGGSFASQGDMFWAKSANCDIYVSDTVLTAANGVILRSVVNDDPWYSRTSAKGPDCYGVQATFENMALAGDILGEDTERKNCLHLNGAALKGRISNFALTIAGGGSWFATGDSDVRLMSADLSAIDAPAGVTIRAVGASGMYDLKSGGKLVGG